jgi:predicted RNA-binding Zn ribbon-like protein
VRVAAEAKQGGAPDAGWVELVGGHPVLDLVNTVAWRHDPDRTVDRLTDAGVLLGWALAAGVLSGEQAERFRAEVAADASLGPQVLQESRWVRAMACRLLQPVAHGRPPGSADMTAVHDAVVVALGRAAIVDVVPLRWEVDLRSVRGLPTAFTVGLWRLLQFEDLRRLRECLDSGCGWLFLDRSKNGSRVWCSSADCGNRSRVRRHYRRHHQSSDRARTLRSRNDGLEASG